MLKLSKGWQRVWLVSSLLALAIIFTVRSLFFAPPTSVDYSYRQALENAFSCTIYWEHVGTAKEFPRPEGCYARTSDEASTYFTAAQKALNTEIRELNAKQQDWWIVTALLWIGVNLAAFVALLVGRWIRQGFVPADGEKQP